VVLEDMPKQVLMSKENVTRIHGRQTLLLIPQ
jgi:hypothetical protein